jgi:hypothetical protein
MFGFCINFHKSAVVVLGANTGEQQSNANMLNCKQGAFPFTYLGLPIGERAITTADWGPMKAKLGSKEGRCMDG